MADILAASPRLFLARVSQPKDYCNVHRLKDAPPFRYGTVSSGYSFPPFPLTPVITSSSYSTTLLLHRNSSSLLLRRAQIQKKRKDFFQRRH